MRAGTTPMRARAGTVAVAVLLAVPAAAAAQLPIFPGPSDPPSSQPSPSQPSQGQTPTLTVYSSLPLKGTSREQSQAVVNGARLALEEAGGRAGRFPIRYISLDDSERGGGTGGERQERAAARRAAADSSAIAYIGAFNSGASKISMPILNRLPLLQVSPSNTYNGLTTDEPGTEPGEPERYFPTGKRHYVRIQPRYTIQSAALVLAMKRARCRRAYLLHDTSVYGAGIAANARRAARRRKLRVVGFRAIRPQARSYRRLARVVKRRRAGCVLFGGTTFGGAVELFRDLSRVRWLKLFASDGVAESAFSAAIPRRAARRTRISVATIGMSAYSAAGRAFVRRYVARFGRRARDPYAIYGYESMALALDSIRRGNGNRQATINAAFATRNRRSILGTYSISSSGDTTLTDYGIYGISRRALYFRGVVRP